MTSLSRTLFSCGLLLLAGVCAPARGEVTLHALFSKNAILQRDKPLPVWGWADVGENVTVTLGAQSASTRAGADRRWRVTLAAQPLCKTAMTLVVKGTNTLEVPNILLGDVWLCSGQSNMTMPMANYPKVPEMVQDVATANSPLIRMFGVEKVFADTPQINVKGEWLLLDKQTAPRFSAFAFYFARKVHAETGVPIGILRSAAGGTNIEMWLSAETYAKTPALAPLAKKKQASLDAWEKEKQAAMSAGKKPEDKDFPRRPRVSMLHNGMIAPLIPFSLRGNVWYQGESNSLDMPGAKTYIERQRALINDWRRYFGDDALPFLYVQLPNYRTATDSPAGGELWCYMRESQRQSLSIPHTGMAVTIDIGEADDIHPRNKFDAGERLALWALAQVYGKTDLVYSGPLFHEAKPEGDHILVSFDHVGSGLMVGSKPARGPAVEAKDEKLRRFAIAGADRQWHWADAIIDGNSVRVSSPDVLHPVAVRYAFSSNPQGCNLYNRAGLPASPFRSDDW
jgi:sialate O-acetylesterase